MILVRLPSWYRAICGAFVALWIAVSIFYRMGAAGVETDAGSRSFEREHDLELRKIDEHTAFRVDRFGPSVTKYHRAMFPFCPLCGVNEQAGTIMNAPRFHKGDWIYTNQPQPFYEAMNLKTGELIDLPAGGDVLTTVPPELAARGLDFAAANQLEPRFVGSFALLSTVNESCVVFNVAFILVLAALLALGVTLAVRRRTSVPIAR